MLVIPLNFYNYMVEEKEKKAKTKTQVALEKLDKDFGKGTAMRMGDSTDTRGIDVIPTGSLQLDLATGIGGIPRGRIIEIYGWESSGKTTITEHIIAEAQKLGLQAALVDAEHAFDEIYAASIGVNVDDLIISQPDYGEQGLQVVETLVNTGEFGLIVIDSVAALVPKKELEGDIGDSSIGLQSRMMGQAMRKLTAVASKNNTALIFINQLREKIGVMFGTPETTSGGNALRFYASMRFDVRKSLDIEHDLNRMKVKIVKNKLARPFRSAQIDVIWGKGFDKVKDVVDLAVEMGIVTKAGAGWYTVGEQKVQGDIAFKALLEDNPEFFKEIEDQVKQKIKDGYERPKEEVKSKKDSSVS